MTARAANNRPAFTIVEAVVSLSVTTMLMGAMMSVMLLSSKAIPDPADPLAGVVDGTAAASQIAGELTYAITFTEQTANAVTFTVADRSGDSNPETIRYAWSGTAGDPLTRQYNGGATVPIADTVQHLALTYHDLIPYTTTELPEERLFKLDATNSGAASDYGLSTGWKLAQCFPVNLQPEAVSWRVTRALFIGAPSGGTNAVFSIEVRGFDSASGPEEMAALGAAEVAESSLVADQWREVQFSDAKSLVPSKGGCIVIDPISGTGQAGTIKHGTMGSLTPNARMYNDNDDTGWWEDANKDLYLEVWGRVSVPADAYPGYVGIQVRVNPEASTSVQTSVEILNARGLLNDDS